MNEQHPCDSNSADLLYNACDIILHLSDIFAACFFVQVTESHRISAGYFRFLNDNRDRVRAQNQGASFSDITRILAGEWTHLPAPEKQVA